MKKFKLFALFLFQGFMTFAQAPAALATSGRLTLPSMDERFQYIYPYDGREKPLVGERYFYDSLYREGELKTTKRLYTTQLSYRFDQIERTVQIKMENDKQVYLYERDIEYIKLFIENKTIVFVPVTVPNGRKLTMVQVIYKSPTMELYRDPRKYIFRVKSENIDGYSSEKVYDEIRKDYRYYFRKGEKGVFKEVKVDVKSFVNVLPEKRTQIIQLFRKGQTKGGLTVTKLGEIMAELDKKEDLN